MRALFQARNYVLDMAEGPRTQLTERFPEAGPEALDLLSKMLTFDPARRISVRDAMRHPWLARFYQVGSLVGASYIRVRSWDRTSHGSLLGTWGQSGSTRSRTSMLAFLCQVDCAAAMCVVQSRWSGGHAHSSV